MAGIFGVVASQPSIAPNAALPASSIIPGASTPAITTYTPSSGAKAPTQGTAPTPQSQTNLNNNNNNNNSDNTSSSASGLNNPNLPEYLQGIEQEYGATINAAPTTQALDTQAEQLGINNATGSAGAQIQQQEAQRGVLGTEENTTKAQQQLSLAELADQIRGQYAGLQAQLGAVGAGSSSAVGLGGQALAHEQNTDRANIQQQTAGNIANIGAQIQGVNANEDAINQWKQNQIATITNNYGQLMNQLSQAVQQAQGEEKARLAEYGQTLTDSANAALTTIEKTTPAQIQSTLTQGAQAEGQLQPAGTPVSAINVPTVSPFSNGSGTDNGNATAPSVAPVAGGSYQALNETANQPLA